MSITYKVKEHPAAVLQWVVEMQRGLVQHGVKAQTIAAVPQCPADINPLTPSNSGATSSIIFGTEMMLGTDIAEIPISLLIDKF